MKFEYTKVSNLAGAIRGMRFPKNSNNKSDSGYQFNYDKQEFDFMLGMQDCDLAQKLIQGGSVHGKFMRQIFVSVDITAPLYWWKEADQSKVGTTTDSASTMHKIAETPITLDCFETDDMDKMLHTTDFERNDTTLDLANAYIKALENLRKKYLATNDVRYWKELIRWLPESWLQKRHWTGNYEVVRQWYKYRRNHKLTEWSKTTMEWIDTLPYADKLIKFGIKEQI